MTPEQRTVSRRICEAATLGPWERYGMIGGSGLSRVRVCVGRCRAGRPTYRPVPLTPADAEFIAHARTALPQALDAADERDAELKSAFFCLGPDYDGEWLCDQKRRPLDGLVTEALARKDNEIERLREVARAALAWRSAAVHRGACVLGIRKDADGSAERDAADTTAGLAIAVDEFYRATKAARGK